MDIEDLTKSQLLLLMILVNFIVSIATGVLTVSLLSQAPANVTQTVNRIVDHTIETIATPIQIVGPSTRPTSAAPSQLTMEQLLTSAVSADASRNVLIYNGATTTPSIAFGVYLPKLRSIVTATVPGLPKEATISFSDGSSEAASLARSNDTITIYGFSDSATLPEAPAAVLPKVSTLKQGQTLVALTKENAAVTGIISKVESTSISSSLVGVPVGGGVVDLYGALIGIGSTNPGVIIAADVISSLLAGTNSSQSATN